MDNIKFSNGWYMPAKDRILEGHMNSKNLFYKERKMWQKDLINGLWEEISESKCRVAIDVGSHIGTWAYFLVDKFDFVHCFEPLDLHQQCWQKNIGESKNAKLYPIALGDKDGEVEMLCPEETTVAAYISEHSYTGKDKQILFNNIPITTLDSFNFSDVDLIKIDVQGHQLKVLKGAEKTILNNKPYIMIEDDSKGNLAIEYCRDHLGMNLIFKHKGDFLMAYGTRNIDGNSPSQNIVGGWSKDYE